MDRAYKTKSNFKYFPVKCMNKILLLFKRLAFCSSKSNASKAHGVDRIKHANFMSFYLLIFCGKLKLYSVVLNTTVKLIKQKVIINISLQNILIIFYVKELQIYTTEYAFLK